MTYSMIVGKYKLIFSDTHFKDFCKKPTISVYDADTNSETKIASFNSQETFEWFVEAVAEADRKTENSSEKPNNCETCIWSVCNYNKAFEDEPQTEHLEQFRVGLEYHTDTTHFGKVKGESITTNKVEDEPQTDCAWK